MTTEQEVQKCSPLSALRSPLSALRSPLSALRSPLSGSARHKRPLLPALALLIGTLPLFAAAPAEAQTLSVTGNPACYSYVTDMSVQPAWQLKLTPAPGTETAVDYAPVDINGNRLGRWRGHIAIRASGTSIESPGDSPFSQFRAAYPGFAGFVFRLRDNTSVQVRCVWRFARDGGTSRQTTIWSATLTPVDAFDVFRGCGNAYGSGKECSDTSVLSDDAFTFQGAEYHIQSIATLKGASASQLSVELTTPVPQALRDYGEVHIGGEPFYRQAGASANHLAHSPAPLDFLTVGTPVTVKLVVSDGGGTGTGTGTGGTGTGTGTGGTGTGGTGTGGTGTGGGNTGGGGGGGSGGGGGGGGSGGGGGGSSTPDDRHGNTPEDATSLNPRRYTTGVISRTLTAHLQSRRDIDYFTLDLPYAGILTASTTGADTTGRLYQAQDEGEPLLVTEDTDSGRGSNFALGTAVEAGTYYLAVSAGRGSGEYRLSVHYTPAAFGNPAPNSPQSGVSVLSGWVCEAERVEIEFETPGGASQTWIPATGTSRPDTAVACGPRTTDTGYGLLFNWNHLGDGQHTVRVIMDDVMLAERQITVTTLGDHPDQEFRRDLAATTDIPDFPSEGETTTLRWQTARQNFVIAHGAGGGGGQQLTPEQARLGIPPPGSFQSGIGVLSGWVCEADTVELVFEPATGEPFTEEAGYGTERGDTAGVCGDTDNGFGLLYNWNRLGDGLHTVRAYADDEEFATVRLR